MAAVAFVFYSPTLKRQIAAYEASGAQSPEFVRARRAGTDGRDDPGVAGGRDHRPDGGEAGLIEHRDADGAVRCPTHPSPCRSRASSAAGGCAKPSPPRAIRCPPRRWSGEVDAEVAIIGGGYTGMWTAWFLSERMPGSRIVLLEQDICGGGPSGRNGGFVHGWWENVPDLAAATGPTPRWRSPARRTRSWTASVPGAPSTTWTPGTPRPGISASTRSPRSATTGTRRSRGWMPWGWATSSFRWTPTKSSGSAPRRPFVRASGCGARPRSSPHGWRAGMRRVLLERGVRIHEGTRVRSLSAGSGRLQLATDGGPRLRRPGRCWRSTPGPAAGRAFAAACWHGAATWSPPSRSRSASPSSDGPAGELLSDSRFTISYFRTTADGRIAFGGGVGAAGYDGRIGHDLHPRPARHRPGRRRTSATCCRCSPTFGSTMPGAGRSTSPATASRRSVDPRWAHALRARLRRQRRRAVAAGRADPRDARRRRASRRWRRCPSSATASRSCRPSRSASSAHG